MFLKRVTSVMLLILKIILTMLKCHLHYKNIYGKDNFALVILLSMS